MLRTFDTPFDFHDPKGGLEHFNQLAAKLASQFDTTPHIIDDPIFSYGITGKSQLERLSQLNDSQPAIVYLSNVVAHSAVLIIGECETTDLQDPLQYDSLDAFLTTPYVRGYCVAEDLRFRASFGDAAIVISDLIGFLDDDDDGVYELPDNGLFRVLSRNSNGFVCNILDYDKYFERYSCNDETADFFLPSNSRLDLEECAKHKNNVTLREFLLKQSAPFATLGDDHMDDEYAVSYGMDCWQCSDDMLAFVR